MDIHPILDQHDAIAWDMDDTLIGGINSDLFRAYIAQTPHKRHHVVTFRNKIRASTVWAELNACGLNTKKLIRSVESCPEVFAASHALLHYKAGAEERRVLNNLTPDVPREEWLDFLKENAMRFIEWKAERANTLGCTIIIDDLDHLVLPGCQKYDVAFFHAFTPHKSGKPISD